MQFTDPCKNPLFLISDRKTAAIQVGDLSEALSEPLRFTNTPLSVDPWSSEITSRGRLF
jgi:hypothetical protein